MILVIVGTHGQQFNRLIAAADALALDEPCVIQYGHSTLRPQHATAHDFIPYEEVERLMQAAKAIVTHAGTGTVMTALSLGKTPVVAPRLARFGEHVDDHQLELVESLSALDLIVPWLPNDNLQEKIALAVTKSGQHQRAPSPELVEHLRMLIDTSV